MPTAYIAPPVISGDIILEGDTPGGLHLGGLYFIQGWKINGGPLAKESGTVLAKNCTIKNSDVSGGAIFFADQTCVDDGGNSGWTFGYIGDKDINSSLSISPQIQATLHDSSNVAIDSSLSFSPQLYSTVHDIVDRINANISFSPQLNATIHDATEKINSLFSFSPQLISSLYNANKQVTGSISFSPQLSGTISNTTEEERIAVGSTLEINLPALQFSLYSGGELSFSIPKLLFSMHGSTDIIGRLNINIPRLLASLHALQEIKGSLVFSLPSLQFGATGIMSEIGQLNIVLPKIYFTASGNIGPVGQLSIVLPALTFRGSAYWVGGNTLDIILPSLQFTAHVTSDDFLILVLNTKNFALTEYDNYKYNSLFSFNGKTYGAKADGIYELTGATDNGSNIAWKFKTGKVDLEDKTAKKARYAWFSYRPSGDLILTIDDGDNQYEYDVESYSEIDNSVRVKIGKGIRNRFIQLELRNVNNESIHLDSIRLFAEESKGKKR